MDIRLRSAIIRTPTNNTATRSITCPGNIGVAAAMMDQDASHIMVKHEEWDSQHQYGQQLNGSSGYQFIQAAITLVSFEDGARVEGFGARFHKWWFPES